VHSEIAALGAQSQPPITVQLRRIQDMHASDGILQTAADEGADLIVMGSHGRTGISRLMLGSITAKVVARASVPVLLARAETDESNHAKATESR
jgi:nucleotide-binding universal stress UspA family protein